MQLKTYLEAMSPKINVSFLPILVGDKSRMLSNNSLRVLPGPDSQLQQWIIICQAGSGQEDPGQQPEEHRSVTVIFVFVVFCLRLRSVRSQQRPDTGLTTFQGGVNPLHCACSLVKVSVIVPACEHNVFTKRLTPAATSRT